MTFITGEWTTLIMAPPKKWMYTIDHNFDDGRKLLNIRIVFSRQDGSVNSGFLAWEQTVREVVKDFMSEHAAGPIGEPEIVELGERLRKLDRVDVAQVCNDGDVPAIQASVVPTNSRFEGVWLGAQLSSDSNGFTKAHSHSYRTNELQKFGRNGTSAVRPPQVTDHSISTGASIAL